MGRNCLEADFLSENVKYMWLNDIFWGRRAHFGGKLSLLGDKWALWRAFSAFPGFWVHMVNNPSLRDVVWYCSTVTHKRDKIIYHWCEEVVGLFIELITDHLINYVAQLLLPGWRQPLENWRLPKAPARPEEEQSGHNHCGCQSSRERAVYLRQIEVRPSLLGISDS